MFTKGGFLHLNTTNQHGVKNMCSLLHDSDVSGCGVSALAVLYGVDEAVPELFKRAQKILLNKIHHTMICGDERFSNNSLLYNTQGFLSS